MDLEVREPCHRLLDRRAMPDRYPPHGNVGFGEALEPLAPTSHHVGMSAAKDERPQGSQVLPYREVDQDAIIGVRTDGCGVAILGLQPPDETRASVANALMAANWATNPAMTGSSTAPEALAMLTWAR